MGVGAINWEGCEWGCWEWAAGDRVTSKEWSAGITGAGWRAIVEGHGGAVAGVAIGTGLFWWRMEKLLEEETQLGGMVKLSRAVGR